MFHEYKNKSEIRKLPSLWRETPAVKGSANIQEMLEAQLQNTLQLAKHFNIELSLTRERELDQTSTGIEKADKETELSIKANVQPVPINKVGDYCEGEDGNTYLPVEYVNVKTMAILDSGAGVAIATKQIWSKWGKPALQKTRMRLQLADGYIEEPLGLLKNVVVTSCGIEYEHTFVVVDFDKKYAYDIILGTSSMR